MFSGVHTAIVTPFAAGGVIDYPRLEALVKRQVEAGVDGVVPVGTTGESPTVDFGEHQRVVETVIRAADGRVKVIAGTGGNSTREAEELTRQAKDAGADGTLQVTPYYNKPTDLGLRRHFEAVAEIGLPVMLYNVPGRTAREIPVDVVVQLAAHPGIVAIKEAAGDSIARAAVLRERCDLAILSGDDPTVVPMMREGGVGVVSVASNVIPEAMVEMVGHAAAGRWPEAEALHRTWERLFSTLFIETNPIPVKTALAAMGWIDEVFRLPMCKMEAHNRETLLALLREYELLS